MSKPEFPFWAKNAGQAVLPPQAKIDQGHNAGQPSAAEFQNWHQNRVGLWIKGLQHNYADITVGSAAQVTTGEATHTVSDFVAAIVAGNTVSFLGGNHFLVRNENITESDVKLIFETAAVIAASTFTLTLSGARMKMLEARFSGFGANDLILSGAAGFLTGFGLDHDWIDMTGDKWIIDINGTGHRTRKFAETLANAAHTLTLKDIGKRLFITPTVTRIITLPTTGVQAGDEIDITNLAAAQKITIKASGLADICSFQNGSMRLMVLQDTPTAPANWRIVEVSGGASPTFSVTKSGANQPIVANTDVNVTWPTEIVDNNANFASNIFTPKVPGNYQINAMLYMNQINFNNLFVMTTRKGSSIIATGTSQHDQTVDHYMSQSVVVNMNGTTDTVKVVARIATATESLAGDGHKCKFSGHRLY